MYQEQITQLNQRISRDYRNAAGIVVLKNGKTMYENYFNECTADTTIHIFSVTKSIVSILIGIAIDRGYIKSVNQKVLDFFPDYGTRSAQQSIQDVTIKDMVTMTAPFKFKLNPYTEYFTSDDWVKSSLDYLGKRPKTGKFQYTPLIGPDILSGILVRAAKQSLLDFAAENLFLPLGITVKSPITLADKEEHMSFLQTQNLSGWVTDPKGINTAGWGLTLTAGDMAKIGQLYLDGGIWEGKQLVPAQWIDESTAVHSYWKKQKLSYGYLWWVEPGNGFSAMGDSGNVIYVNTREQIVISIASLFMPRAKDRVKLIKKYIEPIFL